MFPLDNSVLLCYNKSNETKGEYNMTGKDIQARTKDFVNSLAEIEIELKTVKHRIDEVKANAEKVRTMADAEGFDVWYANHLLDDGLKHISIVDYID